MLEPASALPCSTTSTLIRCCLQSGSDGVPPPDYFPSKPFCRDAAACHTKLKQAATASGEMLLEKLGLAPYTLCSTVGSRDNYGSREGGHMSGLRKYRSSRTLSLMLIGTYIIVAAWPGFKAVEIFPFFNWNLFSYSASVRTDWTVQLRTINGHRLPSPKLYYQMKRVFSYARDRNITPDKVFRNWASAIDSGNLSRSKKLQRLTEDTFMKEIKTATYDLVAITYHPILRIRTGKIDKVMVLGTFRKTSNE